MDRARNLCRRDRDMPDLAENGCHRNHHLQYAVRENPGPGGHAAGIAVDRKAVVLCDRGGTDRRVFGDCPARQSDYYGDGQRNVVGIHPAQIFVPGGAPV